MRDQRLTFLASNPVDLYAINLIDVAISVQDDSAIEISSLLSTSILCKLLLEVTIHMFTRLLLD